MLAVDDGVQGGSDYYVATPSETALNLFLYMTMCGHMHTHYGYSKKRNYYPDLLMMCILNGTMTLRYDKRDYELKAGMTALIDCKQPQHYFTVHNCEFLFIHFNGHESLPLFQHIYKTYGCVFQEKESETASSLLNLIIKRFRNEQFMSEPECSSLLYQIMYALFPQTHQNNAACFSNPGLAKAADYIYGHLEENLNINMLAQLAGLSPFYFSRLFKQQTGTSPYDFIIRLRINRAKHYLKSTEMNIAEIAEASGFNSSSRFTHVFTQRVGLSPREFREFPI